jgi:lysine 6-dehydrogenase
VTRMLVLGAGTVGRAAAWDLLGRGHRVTAADISAEKAGRVGAEVGVPWLEIDVTDPGAVDTAMSNADCVVAAVPYHLGEPLSRAAIRNRCHYFDFGGNPTVVRRQLLLNGAAREAGVAVVPDCGLAPGYANVLAATMIAAAPTERLDVQIRVGVLPDQPVGALRYQLEFAAAGLINEYAEPCEIIENGLATTVDPLGRTEQLEWPGLGMLEAFSTAGGTSTMCQQYHGRVDRLEYKTIRYPGHGAVFAALRELGMFGTEPRFGVVPRELLIELLEQGLPRGAPDVTVISVVVTAPGYRQERRLVDRADDRFSSLARMTAFPTTALCDLVASGSVAFRGTAAMHSVVNADELDAALRPRAIGVMSG